MMVADGLPLLREAEYPCLGARSAVQHGTAVHRSFSSLHDPSQLDALAEGLRAFGDGAGHEGEPRSFIALFPSDSDADEEQFERSLWRLLLELHSRDAQAWPSDAPRIPGARDFRFYFHGRPWFVVGMSPTLERASRHSPFPAFAFNPSAMFDHLRDSGQYERFAATVRSRDSRYSGAVYDSPLRHPELGDAPQYAGREFSATWQCPLPVRFASIERP